MVKSYQRMGIARACGWTFYFYGDGLSKSGWKAPGDKFRDSWWRPYYREDELPDYLYDMNAMWQAEDTIKYDPSSPRWGIYCCNLTILCGTVEQAVHATAAQRAEAFLKTIGRWEGPCTEK